MALQCILKNKQIFLTDVLYISFNYLPWPGRTQKQRKPGSTILIQNSYSFKDTKKIIAGQRRTRREMNMRDLHPASQQTPV